MKWKIAIVLAFILGMAGGYAIKSVRYERAVAAWVALQSQARLSHLRTLQNKTDIVMLGDSITAAAEWHELIPHAVNRGIGGDTSAGVLARLDEVIELRPKAVFLMIGVNDLLAGIEVNTVASNIAAILTKLAHVTPVLQSTLYVRNNAPLNLRIATLNSVVQTWCAERGIRFIDLNVLLSQDGRLRQEMTWDGIHLTGPAYLLWRDALR